MAKFAAARRVQQDEDGGAEEDDTLLLLAGGSGDGGGSAACAGGDPRWRLAPFCWVRLLVGVPMVALVLALVGLSYYPMVVLNRSRGWWWALWQAVFHVLLALMMTAYFQTVLVDPGTVPPRWDAEVRALPLARRAEFRYCKRSSTYKPHRSHYCSVSGRVVLNMDHFCPWVANTVGFYNRKFFVQFVVYTSAACLMVAGTIFFGGARAGLRPSMAQYAALVMDAVLGTVLSCFAAFHVWMVRRNQTSIEGDTCPQFDVGAARNTAQVFGARRWASWCLPLWLGGPAGDGVVWPVRLRGDRKGAIQYVGAPQVNGSGSSSRDSSSSSSRGARDGGGGGGGGEEDGSSGGGSSGSAGSGGQATTAGTEAAVGQAQADVAVEVPETVLREWRTTRPRLRHDAPFRDSSALDAII